MNTSIFREYDIRAVVDVDLTDEEVTTLGQAFGTFLRDRQVTSAVLGWDSRASSPRWRDRMTEGLIKTGIHVIDIGQVTTPIFILPASISINRPGS